MAREDSEHNRSEDGQLSNLITVVGRGVPSSFEFSVEGDIEMIAEDPADEATIITDGAVEGAIEVGVQQFRFSGELANIRTVDWNGVEGAEARGTPTIHVNYSVPDNQ